MATEPQVERRSFLQRVLLTGGLAISFGGLATILADIWLAAGHLSSAHWRSLAKQQELPSDGVFPFPEQGVALLVRQHRVAALSLVCTHLGCLLNVIDEGFFCPCHGSEFGPLGEVYSGPATRSLPWHAVKLHRGKVWVETGVDQELPIWVAVHSGAGGRA